MRDVALERPTQSRCAASPSVVAIARARHRRRCSSGLFGDSGIALRRPRRAARVRRRVRARPAVRPAAERRRSARRSRRSAGSPARSPARTRRGTRSALRPPRRAHDRCRAGRLHHDLRGVGQGVGRRTRSTQQFKTDYIVTSRVAAVRAAAVSARAREQIAALPEIQAVTGPGRRQAAINGNRTFLIVGGAEPDASQLFDFDATSPARSTDLDAERHRGLEEEGRQPSLEARRSRAGDVREDRQRPDEGRSSSTRTTRCRRLLHLAGDVREELRRPARLPRSSPSSSRA